MNDSRIKVKALTPSLGYEEEVGNYYTGKDEYIVPPHFSWKNMYISTREIKDLEQYSNTTTYITYHDGSLPLLVRGSIDEIYKAIIESEYTTFYMYSVNEDNKEDNQNN